MTAPLNLRLTRNFRKEGKPELLLSRFVIALLAIAFFYIAMMLYSIFTHPGASPNIREVTPGERKQVAYLEDKFGLHGLFWAIDRENGEISYYRKGVWRVIK